MSRLIDADKLIKDIVKLLQPARPDETEMYKADDIFWSVEKLIKEQPTAYDVDKVVEQLEKLSTIHYSRFGDYMKQGNKELAHKHLLKFNAYHKAIDRVKAGGIDE